MSAPSVSGKTLSGDMSASETSSNDARPGDATPFERRSGFLPTRPDGSLRRLASPEKIVEPWLQAVRETLDIHRQQLGDRLHSFYVRGSVAEGRAIAGVSDLDTLTVTTEPVPRSRIVSIYQLAQQVPARHRFLTDVEVIVLPHSRIAPSTAGILIATQSACVWGPDLAEDLPAYRPGPQIAQHTLVLERELARASRLMEGQDVLEPPALERLSQRVSKHLVRAGFELVMEREGSYTRDLVLSYESFARHYPERAEELCQALELAIQPSSDPRRLHRLLQSLGPWMVEKASEFVPR